MLKQLLEAILRFFFVSRPAPPTPPVIPAPPTPPPSLDSLEALRRQLLALHNAARTGAGAAPLARDPRLDQTAQAYAAILAADDVLSHTEHGTLEGRLRAVQYPFQSAGENIAEGYPNAGLVMSGWFQSSEHYANIINAGFTDVGFGRVFDRSGVAFWCADFGHARATIPFGTHPGAPTRYFRDAEAARSVTRPPPLVHLGLRGHNEGR